MPQGSAIYQGGYRRLTLVEAPGFRMPVINHRLLHPINKNGQYLVAGVQCHSRRCVGLEFGSLDNPPTGDSLSERFLIESIASSSAASRALLNSVRLIG